MNPRQKRSPRSSSPQDAPSQSEEIKRISDVIRKPSGGRLQGAALVIVLAFLVIITGLVVAFLSSVTNEATATSASAAAVTTHTLADAAVQLTIAQIRDATAGFAHNSDGSLNTASAVAWASQPGAIRTWGTNPYASNGGGAGFAGGATIYKLYSAQVMVDSSGGNPTNDLPTSSLWVSNSAIWTDLNSPVVSSGNTNYPIIDPSMTNTVNGLPVVDGFSIDTSSVSISGVANPAAMPMRWIYVLKNGTLTIPSGGSNNAASFSSNAPSSSNPIVGRIAFWADDETCKLNINTASEGSFWATPSATTVMDLSMALTPPVNKEYNRYPGHPASTSLSPVLWSYFGLTNGGGGQSFTGFLPGNYTNGYNIAETNTGNSILSTVTNYYTNLFTNLTPRYYWGGSASGVSNTLQGINAITNLPSGRLYSSIDELFFAATNPSGAINGRVINPFLSGSTGGGSGVSLGSSGGSARQISALRFFLTTDSRAPEVNPYNLPKLTLWPVPATNAMTANPQSTGGATRTLADQTIAFCSTFGPITSTNTYYFTRYDATSPTNDVSGRNQTLYNYLRNLMNSPVPGYNGSFSASSGSAGSGIKWSALQADQISTLLFDYIRSCINLVDSGSVDITAMTNSSTPYKYSYTYPPTNTVTLSTNNGVGGLTTNVTLQSGTGQVVPVFITNPDGNVTKGIGRFPTIRSGTLWFVARGADQPPVMVHPDHKPIVYLSNGTQISTNVAGVSSIITNYMSNVLLGQGYAKINPMHPWTCPQTNVVGSLTNVVPQLLIGTSPVLADTNYPSIPSARHFTNSSDCAAVYPIFNLNTNNAGNNTRTYPTLNMSNSWIFSTNLTTSNSFSMVDPFPFELHSGRTIYCFYIPRGMRHLCGGGGGGGGTNTNPPIYYYPANLANTNSSKNITHGGLPYLTVQNPKTGGFDLTNANYKDTLTPALQPHQTRMEVLFLPSLANVAPGAVGYCPSFNLTVQNLNTFTVNSTNMGFPSSATITNNTNIVGINGGSLDLTSYGLGADAINNAMANLPTTFASNYPVVSAAAPTGEVNGATFTFGGGTITNAFSTTNASSATVQTIAMNFPNAVFPTPKLPPYVLSPLFPPTNTFSSGLYTNSQGAVGLQTTNGIAGHQYLTFNGANTNPLYTSNGTIDDGVSARYTIGNSWGQNLNVGPSAAIPQEFGVTTNAYNVSWYTNGLKFSIPYTMESVEARYGDLRQIATLSNVPSSFFTTNPFYGYSNSVTVNGWPMYIRNGYSLQEHSTYMNGSIVGTLLPTDASPSSNNWNYLGAPLGNPVFNTAYSVTSNSLVATPSGFDSQKIFFTTNSSANTTLPFTVPTCDFKNATFQAIWQQGGDFDNGYGCFPDGPFINKVDEGYGMFSTNWTYGQYFNPYYTTMYQPSGKTLMSPNRMVPSAIVFGSLPVGFAQMSSVSSPSTNILTNSWLTLQFSPNPNAPSTNFLATRNAASGYSEGGSTATNTIPPDHLLLDFFQMPVVEPYPISDPFSTAGKVNMNYSIAPFNYITRSSAIRGVMKSVMITAIDESYAGMYKYPGNFGTTTYPAGTSYNQLATNSANFYFHYPINPVDTLAQFTNRFGSNDLFHSASEICSIWLYPARQPSSTYPTNNLLPLTNSSGTAITYTSGNSLVKSWWYSNPGTTRKGLTGDNLRERPYGYLYPRLTTKSNTYQIHYRVQTLKQNQFAHASDAYATWVDPSAGGITDKVLGEQRGSAVIERFIDPSNPSIPDFASAVTSSSGGASLSSTNCMDSFYQFRVFNAKQFTP